jgi:hypothetical protein
MRNSQPISSEFAPVGVSLRTFAYVWAPALILLCIALGFLAASMYINHGHVIYALDDPYIHLALAEHIWQGEYGINSGEFSAPSSSILWPVLLVPFVPLGIDAYAPLLWNLFATVGTAVCLALIVQRAVTPELAERHRWLLTAVVVLFLLSTNAIGLIFSGMEHSLQVLLAAMVVLGLIDEHETGQVRWYLLLGVILGPLVRYENLALTVPAVAYLLWRRQWVSALVSGTTVGVILMGFGAWLLAHDLFVVPTSILAKANQQLDASPAAMFIDNVKNVLEVRESIVLLLALLIAAPIALTFKRPDWRLAFWLCAAISLHLLVGKYGWFSRYEIYIVVTAAAGSCYLVRAPIRHVLRTRPVPLIVFTFVFGLAVLFPNYIILTSHVVTATNNIYEQHYHMHRFLDEYYPHPVAVQDLGWPVYRNDQYVLDLGGLASLPLLTSYKERYGRDWLEAITQDKQIELLLLYGDTPQRSLPEGWQRVAELTLSRKRITPFDETVAFYATNAATAERLRPRLQSFQATLEPEIQLELVPPPQGGLHQE